LLVSLKKNLDVLVSLVQMVGTIHNICKVWDSNFAYHKKIKNLDFFLSYYCYHWNW